MTISSPYNQDAAVSVAVTELSQALSTFVRGQGRLVSRSDTLSGSAISVTAGDTDSPEVRGLVWQHGLALPELGQEGYVIQPLLQAKPPGILVVGGSALGIAYGLLALAEDLRLERTYLQYPLP